MASPPSIWRAPVCYDSLSIASKLRETLDGLGWTYTRDRTVHSFSRMWVAISLPSTSYVFRFKVKAPIRITIDAYDERPTHSGELHFIEIKGLRPKNAGQVRQFLNDLAKRLPRKPYEFFWQERFRAGLLNREHMLARKEWSRWGI